MSIRLAALLVALLALSACASTAQDYAVNLSIPAMTPKIGVFSVAATKDEQFFLHYQLSADEWAAMRGLSTAALSAAPGSFLVWDKPGSRDPKGHPILMVQALTEILASGGCRSVEWLMLHDKYDDQGDLKALLLALDGIHAGVPWMSDVGRKSTKDGIYDSENFITICPTKAGGAVYAFDHLADFYGRTDPSVWKLIGNFNADPGWITAETKAGHLIVKSVPVPPPSIWDGPVPEPAAHRAARLAAAGGAVS